MRSNTNQELALVEQNEREKEVCYILRQVGMGYQIVAWLHHQNHTRGQTINIAQRGDPMTSGAVVTMPGASTR